MSNPVNGHLTEFVFIPEIPEGWSEDDFINRLQAAVDLLEADASWDDENGETVRPWIVVRLPRHGEARGTYEVRADQTLQILGFTVAVPEGLRRLREQAFEAVCQ